MKASRIPAALLGLISLSLPACHMQAEAKDQAHHEHHQIVVTTPLAKDVVITQEYVCQIHSRRHIKVCALQSGYLQEILVGEGQMVHKGDPMFKILPTLYKATYDAELAEAEVAEIEYKTTAKLYDEKVVSVQDLNLHKAKLARAKARVQKAEAELNFTKVVAPFDGIVDKLEQQLGSLIKEGEILTTLSDNGLMWVYFNVPEKRYLEYMASLSHSNESQQIELLLATGQKFPHSGRIAAIEAKFNNETGNIPFRADFENPDRLLRHGQTGTVLIHRTVHDAIVIPQRATFEVLDKQYAYVVGKDDVVHQREITVEHEMDDIYVIKSGLAVDDKIVLEGVRQVHEGEKVEFTMRSPQQALSNQKHHAE